MEQRLDAGLTRNDVVRSEIVRSTRILKRLEYGHSTTVTYPTINALCRLYGATESMRRETERMFRNAGLTEWRESRENWINDTALMMEIERRASTMLVYEPLRVHGLLQTIDYIGTRGPRISGSGQENIERTIEQRRRRQRYVWARTGGFQIRFVLGLQSMRSMEGTDQGAALRAYAHKTNASIRVQTNWSLLDFYEYPFTVLAFDGGDSGCVYTETISSHRYEAEPEAVTAYTDFFESLYKEATPIEEFADADIYLAQGDVHKWRR